MKQHFASIMTAFVVIAVLFTGFDSHAQSRKRVPIEYQNSEVSFTGDDRFIARRFAWEPFSSDYIWQENLQFNNGFVSYAQLVPGYFFTGQNAGKDSFVDTFNGSRWIARRGVSVTEQDVKEGSNNDGDYYYATKSNGDKACGLAKIFTGDTNADGGMVAVGTMVASVYICWESYNGTVSEMETALIDIMSRMRLDEGKLNKARAARGDR